jgi:hypothetical protein
MSGDFAMQLLEESEAAAGPLKPRDSHRPNDRGGESRTAEGLDAFENLIETGQDALVAAEERPRRGRRAWAVVVLPELDAPLRTTIRPDRRVIALVRRLATP